uniref:Uncharacterized protein n=1 Tax=Oryza brachyantha TaxID=4533 RepID=J3LVQ6_ORYBR
MVCSFPSWKQNRIWKCCGLEGPSCSEETTIYKMFRPEWGYIHKNEWAHSCTHSIPFTSLHSKP